jgi:hypothetical protein
MTDTEAMEVADRASVVKSVRDQIDAVVSRERRREILVALGCFEPPDQDTVPRLRRAEVPRTAGGAELLAAIDALDHACLQGSDAEIDAAGERLMELWTMFR